MWGSQSWLRPAFSRLFVIGLLLLPAHAADYRDHVGVYVWGRLPGGLAEAAADAKRLGADHVVRLYIGPRPQWTAGQPDDTTPLDAKVRRRDYQAFLSAFPVVMLTAYDSASYEIYKHARVDAAHLAATKDEFRRFTLELAKLPGRKIVSNWEFENDCQDHKQWDICGQYLQTRLDGILAGRREAKALGYPGDVQTAFEFTVVPDFKGRASALVEIGGRLKGLDYYSYSSWWSIGAEYDATTMYKSFDWGMGELRRYTAEHKLTPHWIVGEFGEYWNVYPKGDRLKAIVDASLARGVDYLFNWVLYDQPANKDEWGHDASHFGKYDLKRALTPQGQAFQRWFK